jgi:hypothetical protein
VQSIVTYDGPLAEAFAPMSVTMKLEDEIDLSRGDMLVSPDSPPQVSQRFAAMLVWMNAQPLESGHNYLIKQSARQVRGRVTRIRHRVNTSTLEPEAAERLHMNDIASVELETNSPLFFDSYEQNRITGSFIVIDPLTNATLGAGMIREDLSEEAEVLTAEETRNPEAAITPFERHRRHGHYPAIFLVNGRAGLARQLERALFETGFETIVVETKASFSSARTACTTLLAAGLVVLYHNPSLKVEEKVDLKAAESDHFFDLSELNLPEGDTEAIEQILVLAESLRIPAGAENPKKVV